LFERRSLDDSNDKSKSPLFGSQKRKPAITMHAERGVNTGSPLLNSTQRASSEITTPPDARNNALAYQQSPPVAPIPAFPYQANQQFHPSYFASVPSSPFFMGNLEFHSNTMINRSIYGKINTS
jgi:hypothetical protein